MDTQVVGATDSSRNQISLGSGGPLARATGESSVTIVIPAFNEVSGVAPVVAGLRQRFPRTSVIVVDDGSSDDTASEARKAGARVISHDRNRGYGAALRTGVEAAASEYVLFCDADGQHSPEDVARIIEACGDWDMIVGVRGKDSHAPLLRRPGKMVLRLFSNYLAGERIPDLNSGLRALRRDLLLKYMHLMPTGFSFSTTSTFAMLKTQRRVKWVPIKVAKRVGKSTVRQLTHGKDTVLLMLRLAVLFEPLKVFLAVTKLLVLACLTSFGLDVFRMINDRTGGVGDMTVVLSVSALIVFMSGLLCDQISALRREFHD